MTVAHMAIIDAVLAFDDVDELHLVLSVDPLGKPGATTFEDRLAAVRERTATIEGIDVRATKHRLLVDVAAGYDVLILGADKWAQINDPTWYGSVPARDDAIRRLPPVLVVPRFGAPVPPGVRVLQVDPVLADVSSTAVREGREDWRA